MNKKATFFTLLIAMAVITASLIALLGLPPAGVVSSPPKPEEADKNRMEKIQKKADRADYYFRMLRDPATNAMPENVRNREINKARTIRSRGDWGVRFKRGGELMDSGDFSWQATGPFDVGGRTRALGIDRRDPDIIIAGGVSGGIWKSTDGGDTWDMKTSELTSLSVTSLAQDPTDPDTWYYVTGEYLGASASDRGFRAPYFGTGVYRSTDNGETWEQIPSTEDEDGSFNSPFDFMSRVIVTENGEVFVASTGVGILRLDQGSDQFELVLGSLGGHLYADVVSNSNGDLLAVLSEADAGQTPSDGPGIYLSTDNGDNWDDVTPSTFPETHRRSVAAFSPSDPDIAYVMTLKGQGDSSNQGISFHWLDLGTGDSDDRSENLPDFGDPVGDMEPQSGYNMVVDVHPEDPDFVLVGGINLFRSTDGFATSPAYDNDNEAQKDEFWIGGYSKDNDIGKYPEQHPDQHVMVFDPTDSDRLWAGHDGGVSVTEDVTAASVSWEDKNEGYVTSQFYTVALSDEEGDNRIMGGTQDNGTPFFRFNNGQTETNPTADVSSGDGGYAFFTPELFYVASQNGRVIRYSRDNNDNLTGPLEYVSPQEVDDQLFVHPYIIDPNDEGIMYYPGGSDEEWSIWRNTETDKISGTDSDGATSADGWEEMSSTTIPPGYLITAITTSRNPGNILFYAASSQDGAPRLYRLQEAHTSDAPPEDISIPAADAGSYIHDIEVSPINSDEMVVVLSNYNVESVYHTDDGGESWEGIEGNLAGNGEELGPSVRSAVIIPGEEGSIYFVGTSTGVYSTSELNGGNTQWEHESTDELGYAVAEHLNARYSDGTVLVGSHGRGTHLGTFQGSTGLPSIAISPDRARAGDEVTITASNFQFEEEASDNEVEFGSANARIISGNTRELVVEVPRGAIERDAETNTAQVKVTSGSQSVTRTFEVIPPEDFTIAQNYPNPFSADTRIPFDISTRSAVTIQIYNITGQLVQEPIKQEIYEDGSYAKSINLSGLASGVYFYRFIAQPYDESVEVFVESQKMTLVK